MRALKVAVIGGGWAGLSAAVEATRQGHAVTLHEMAAHWGGRARGVDAGGLALDNGQHILIGAYCDTLRMIREVGVDTDAAFLRTPLQLPTPDGRGLRLPGGSPLVAFARGVMSHHDWPLRQRLALLLAASGWALKRFRCDAAMTVDQLTIGLPAAIREELIDPLCIAALNTPAAAASARVFLRVIRDALFSGPGSSDLLLPRCRLSELFPTPAVRWLAERGAVLHIGSRVESLARCAARWSLDGETFDAVIVAATAVEAARLIGPVAPTWAQTAEGLRHEPIVTVYARSEGARLPAPMLALPCDESTRPAQFVFDQGQLGGAAGLLAFVISGAQPWVDRGMELTRKATLTQGHELLAQHLGAPLNAVRVLTEKRATFRCTPSLRRPSLRVAEGLFAAGDYVAGPYPATIEGAVRSAIQAVNELSVC